MNRDSVVIRAFLIDIPSWEGQGGLNIFFFFVLSFGMEKNRGAHLRDELGGAKVRRIKEMDYYFTKIKSAILRHPLSYYIALRMLMIH
jgi:hypothetical protein